MMKNCDLSHSFSITRTSQPANSIYILKASNYITIDFHQDMGQEFSTVVQIIVKADRGKRSRDAR